MRVWLAASILSIAASAQAGPLLLVVGDEGGLRFSENSRDCENRSLLEQAASYYSKRFERDALKEVAAFEEGNANSAAQALKLARKQGARFVLRLVVKRSEVAAAKFVVECSDRRYCAGTAHAEVFEVKTAQKLGMTSAQGTHGEICERLAEYDAIDRFPAFAAAIATLKKGNDERTAAEKNAAEARARAVAAEQQDEQLQIAHYKPGQHLAVLEFDNALPDKKVEIDRLALSDQVRSIPGTRAPGLLVMARESVTQILEANKKSLEDCDTQCETETGRKLGADYIVSGRIYRSGSNLKLMLKLFRTADGTLLKTALAYGKDQDALETGIEQAAVKLFSVLKRE